MKYAVFAAAVVFGIPIMAMAARSSRQIMRILFAAIILLPAINISIKFFVDMSYAGDARSLEITFVELIATALLISMAMNPKCRRIRLFPKNSLLFFLFIAISFISLSGAILPFYGLFTIYRFMAAYLVFIVVYNYLRNYPRDFEFIVFVFVLALSLQTVYVLRDKYIYGVYRVTGTFWHPNTLSIYVELLAPIVLSILLYKRPKYELLYWIALGGGLLAVISTFSRAGLVILGSALFLVIMLSMLQKLSARKFVVLTLLCLLAFGGAIKAYDSVVKRFLHAPESSEDTRDRFNNAAKAMASDHTFGVGINNYSYNVNNTDYARFFDYDTGHAGVCHHIYLLTAAETGYIGLAAFLLLIFGFYWRALRLSLRRNPKFVNALGVGIFAGATAFHLHGLLEWIFRGLPILYMYFTISGALMAAEELNKKTRKVKSKNLRGRSAGAPISRVPKQPPDVPADISATTENQV